MVIQKAFLLITALASTGLWAVFVAAEGSYLLPLAGELTPSKIHPRSGGGLALDARSNELRQAR
jgi:hypothetical protein